MRNDNPLLDFTGLPRFAELRPAHVTPALGQLLAEARAAVASAERAGPVWEEFVTPLEDANERVGRAWGQIAHLHAVLDSPELRAAYNENLPKITQYWTELGQNQALFEKYRALRAAADFAALSSARQRIVENALRDFRLGGAELPADKKPRYAQIQDELARLAAKFSENLLDATNAWTLVIEDEKRLAGIPADVLQAARLQDGRGWKFTLHMPSYLPVMQYAEDRSLREEMYRASSTRASEFGNPAIDNTPLIARILPLRHEAARLLGYANYADVSLVPKMADSPSQVLGFLEDLAVRARPHAERDLEELREFGREALGLATLEAWDIAWASEKLRQKRYAYSDQEVKQYFPEDAVLAGLFRLVDTLYAVRVTPASAPVWHGDVRFFEVRDARGELVGQFYMDLYARDTKRGGAWMDDARARRRRGDAIQTPVAYLNCNFPRPVGGRPALFTHDDVITLFHEFGHGLHHLLTRVEELGVSGIAGVEWDAVELPSQFMENFCWEWEVLRHMTRHVDTGEALPRALFDRMLAAKNFQSGLAMLRQIEFSVFDMRLHSDFDPASRRSALELLQEVRARIAVLHPPEYNRFPNSFSHIFAGGYAAGYYSYKWAEVLSADAYGAFEESASVTDALTGARFRDEVLAVGGSRPAAESFRAFRGREPRVDALLRHNGMIAAE
ncbi:MAG: M3 family metallopeptidase [Betaproteobacteria bacterium]|nr:M3 family metallopeptidase [Betaproteobacteria bacterium]MDH5350740.1 M3 family metallopeptidase [Betaproteobacteria bacterium]